VYQIVFFRAIGTLASTFPLILKYKISIFGSHKKLLLIRGFLGLIPLSYFIQSLNYLSVGGQWANIGANNGGSFHISGGDNVYFGNWGVIVIMVMLLD
jgi:hypothetical protein